MVHGIASSEGKAMQACRAMVDEQGAIACSSDALQYFTACVPTAPVHPLRRRPERALAALRCAVLWSGSLTLTSSSVGCLSTPYCSASAFPSASLGRTSANSSRLAYAHDSPLASTVDAGLSVNSSTLASFGSCCRNASCCALLPTAVRWLLSSVSVTAVMRDLADTAPAKSEKSFMLPPV